MYARRRIVVLAVAAVIASGCRAGSGSATAEPVALSGYLSIAVGDPAPPGGTPKVFVTLTTETGRSLNLVADSAHPTALDNAGRFHAVRVRATGRFARGDSTVLFVQRLDSLVSGRP